MAFELTQMHATITSFTGRVETHGKEKVPAVSLGFQIITANTILDVLDPSLRTTLYKSIEEQDPLLPGIDPATPLLRTDSLGVISLDKVFEGWTVTVEHGIDDEGAIELAKVKIDSFKIVARQGGTVELSFRAGTSALDTHAAGLLWSKNSSGVVLTLAAPKPQEQAIDGSVEAFERDHPGQSDMLTPEDALAGSLVDE